MRKEHMRFGLGLRGVHTLLRNELLLLDAEYVRHDPRCCSFLEGELSSEHSFPNAVLLRPSIFYPPGPKVDSSKVSN
jgi:hypothetical protein